MSVQYYEGTSYALLTCPRCWELVEIDARDAWDWERTYRIPVEGDYSRAKFQDEELLCIPCRDEVGILWRGKREKETTNEPAPTPPGVKRECATCEGVFDVPIDTPCATCYGHTNWRPGAKK